MVRELSSDCVEPGVKRSAGAAVAPEDYPVLFLELPVPAWVQCAGTAKILLVNNAALAQYGYSQQEFLGLHADQLRAAGPDAGQSREGVVAQEREKHRSKAGAIWEVCVRHRLIPFQGRPALLVVAAPVAPASPAQAAQQERTAQLEAINGELEAFAYSVSHDLRAPLRSIRGFSEALLERNYSQLDDQGRDFLTRVCQSSKHMERLIEDLLKLSRVSQLELHLQEVDLSALAAQVASEIRKADPGREAEILIDPGLKAYGDERLFEVMLDNLLQNAWKFTSREPRARIEFRREPGAGNVFVLRDNGVGFDMQYSAKLFGVFQRLHSPTEFPGTGIGLATVRRIVNRHSGKVWAEAAVGQGASIYLQLPAPGPAPQGGQGL